MKVLIAGDWHSDLHEQEVMLALRRLGHEVAGFKWHHYYAGTGTGWRSVWLRAQNKYVMGPTLWRINRDFVRQALAERPDMIFVYRGTHITAQSLQRVRQALPACVLVGYNNDDPFAPTQPKPLWRHFLAATAHYDLMLAYRHANLADFRAAGAKRVELMRSWYVPQRNHPVSLNEAQNLEYETDVVFIGHFEPDQRLKHLEEIVRQGVRLRLFGPDKYWSGPLARSATLKPFAPTRLVWGEDYNRALCGAKIALCFLSKLNRDTYTRRCFEIPATGTLMLSEYSDDLASIFQEGSEVEFFRDLDEMMHKIKLYLSDAPRRERVAAAGRARVVQDGHDIDSRMGALLKTIEGIQRSSSTT
ncbi:glycosyltransferase [Curvibacter sp. HBC28]|uniref:Glycosyltransferase n=1 Tax=Curvibacter microcysteis TaxID=3026419 RepID=A0ABT5MFQ2_9BURK|nr:glycosyltransferase [Curvibacter sp. HBC28]MDD0815393.1 glycosyltransferase [Curvibacter sp. HBC28]